MEEVIISVKRVEPWNSCTRTMTPETLRAGEGRGIHKADQMPRMGGRPAKKQIGH